MSKPFPITLKPGRVRTYDLDQMRRQAETILAQDLPPTKIKQSPYITAPPGRVEIFPETLGQSIFFSLEVDEQYAGQWHIQITEGIPFRWQAMGQITYLHGQHFSIIPGYRNGQQSKNHYALALRQNVLQTYLAPNFKGWLLDSNTGNPKAKKLFATIHQVERLVQSASNYWHMFTYIE